MEVLRDHLLGVSDSGKVSGRGSGAPRQVEGPWRGAAHSGFALAQREHCGSRVELERLALRECKQPGH